MASVAAAAGQATAAGREIHRLAIVDGKLYPAFGDYNNNTGPIALLSLDLAAQTLGATELTALTEQTWTQRVYSGELFVPYLDPQGFEFDANGYLAIRDTEGDWSTVTTVDPSPAHVFDVAVTAGGWFLAGSTEGAEESSGNGVVWRSTDNGATWAASLTITGANAVARVYALAQFGNELVAFFTDGLTSEAHHWNGTVWTDVTADYPHPITNTRVPFTIDSTDVWLGLEGDRTLAPVPQFTPRIVTLPGDVTAGAAIEAGLPAVDVYDAATDSTHLYLLDTSGQVHRCDATGDWSVVTILDTAIARSLAVDESGGFLYFGTTDSRILRTALPD